MEKIQTTVRMPNGEICLATKVKSVEKAYIRCWNCKTLLVYEKDADTVKCAVCGNLNGINNELGFSQFVVFRCNNCSTRLRAPIIHPTVSCVRCGSISIISPNRN